MAIHSTAIVHPDAQLHPSVEVGPYCIISAGASIGEQTRLLSHVVIHNRTTIGARNTIHPFASIGNDPQDLKFGGEAGELFIGDDNVIRESVTLNIGTKHGGLKTVVGNGNLLMAYSHVAHDCLVGNNVVLANCASLAGHVEVGDHVIFGGLSAVHQFCRIGRHAFIAGGGMVAQDVPPFCLAQGDRAQLAGVNAIGLKRAGWSREEVGAVREAFRALFQTSTTRMTALEQVEQNLSQKFDKVKEMTDFIRQASRGICQPRTVAPQSDAIEN